jgi:anhydro-N-acetylmuramic acid kinase
VILERLRRAMEKDERLCIGLISGTSVDAIEAALCRIRGTGAQVSLELVAHLSVPFDPALQERVLSVRTAHQLSGLNVELGERFAEAALAVIRKAGVQPGDVDVIGSHGQTVAHLAPGTALFASTLQLGEPSVIAERTGIPTVADFRPRDMAAGGQGAPLVAYLDWALFRKAGTIRALQNIGGIANGPGNMILDGLARRATGGQLSCDQDGTLSSRGTVVPELLRELLAHPFLAHPPPRSGGREEFGEALADSLWGRFKQRPWDLIATAAAFTVEATARAYEAWVFPRYGRVECVFLSGGGTRNPTLLEGFRKRLSPVPVDPLDRLGFPEEAKEAACFALLASEFLSGTPQNVPSATGARHPVLMGKLVP